MFPSIDPTNGDLYFASDFHPGYGGLDIFVAENDNGAWEVSNAGFLINTAKDDFGLIFDEQKNIGYFASNRKGGNGSDDLYIISTKSNQQVVNVQAVNAQKQVAQAKPVSYNGANKATPTLIDERYSAPQQHNSVADNTPISPKLTYNSAPQLLLIGIVLDKVTKQPIGGLNVELEDMVTKERQAFQLQNDGNFYFQLESEKRYELMVVNDKGIIGESKYISTINKVGPQVMHTILEGNAYDVTKKSTKVKATSMATDFKTYEQPELATFETYEQPKTDTGNTYHEDSFIDNNSDLVFKIQVGAFKSPLDVDNNFFNEISGEINPERAPSGLTRYVTGNFSNYDSADKYRKELIRRGINTAFVAAYLNGHRMELPVDEVIDMYSEHK